MKYTGWCQSDFTVQGYSSHGRRCATEPQLRRSASNETDSCNPGPTVGPGGVEPKELNLNLVALYITKSS